MERKVRQTRKLYAEDIKSVTERSCQVEKKVSLQGFPLELRLQMKTNPIELYQSSTPEKSLRSIANAVNKQNFPGLEVKTKNDLSKRLLNQTRWKKGLSDVKKRLQVAFQNERLH